MPTIIIPPLLPIQSVSSGIAAVLQIQQQPPYQGIQSHPLSKFSKIHPKLHREGWLCSW